MELGKEYKSLFDKGIDECIRHSGTGEEEEVWTDFNTHDPGVTILEYLCYALTEIGYLCDLSMQDILKPYPPPDESSTRGADDMVLYNEPRQLTFMGGKRFIEEVESLYPVKQILPSRALTVRDYRKILMDHPLVRNAKVEKLQTPLSVKGAYSVQVEFETDLEDAVKEQVCNRLWRTLQKHRNLCETFQEPTWKNFLDFTIEADIEIVESEKDYQHVFGKIAYQLDHFCSPEIDRASLTEKQAAGVAIDHIFEGPFSENGFYVDNDLPPQGWKRTVRVFDLYEVIGAVAGVKAVNSVTILKQGKRVYNLDVSQPLRFSLENSKIALSQRGVDLTFEMEIVQRWREMERTQHQAPVFSEQELKVEVPTGTARDLEYYYSIQNHFPNYYKIAQGGISANDPEQRKAQAKQLKAYLLLFEQMLANAMSQLAHLRNLFSYNPQKQSYFSQKIKEVSDLEELLKSPEDFAERLQKITETSELFHQRRNRFLDHMLARFAENTDDLDFLVSSMQLDEEEAAQHLIRRKEQILRNYCLLSRDRSKARNYAEPIDPATNASGLESRLQTLLDFDTNGDTLRKFFVYTCETDPVDDKINYRFYLKGQASDDPRGEGDVLMSSHQLYHNEAELERAMREVCAYGLNEQRYEQVEEVQGAHKGQFTLRLKGSKDYILMVSQYFSNQEECSAWKAKTINRLQELAGSSLYLVEHIHLYPIGENPKNHPAPAPRDNFYSFRVSVVLPEERFPAEAHRLPAEKIGMEATPSHIIPHFLWVSKEQMIEFENAYFQWCKDYANCVFKLEDYNHPDLIRSRARLREVLWYLHAEEDKDDLEPAEELADEEALTTQQDDETLETTSDTDLAEEETVESPEEEAASAEAAATAETASEGSKEGAPTTETTPAKPDVPVAITAQPIQVGVRPEYNGYRLKAPNADAVYLILDGKKCLIPNPKTYDQLFINWNDIRTDVDLNTIEMGTSISEDALLAKLREGDAVYLVNDSKKRLIPHPSTMKKYHFDSTKVTIIDKAIVLQSIADGDPIN